MNRNYPILLTLGFALVFLAAATAQTDGPLPSWNEGKSKQAIIQFVEDVTKQGGPNYFPPAERIATFDNDGTLDKALDQAEANGWIIVDMKNDWKTVFPGK